MGTRLDGTVTLGWGLEEWGWGGGRRLTSTARWYRQDGYRTVKMLTIKFTIAAPDWRTGNAKRGEEGDALM